MIRYALLFAILTLAIPLHAQERALRVPFHAVNGMILLEGTVNGKLAALLFDTGADNSIIAPQFAGMSANLDPLKAGNGAGAGGDYTKAKIDLRLEKRHWIERAVLVMDLSEVSKRLGTPINGFIGQDILREFSTVRIDYKAGVVEFEK